MSNVIYRDRSTEGNLVSSGDYVLCKAEGQKELWGIFFKKLNLIIGINGKSIISISEEDYQGESSIYVGIKIGEWEVADYIKNEKANITIERN